MSLSFIVRPEASQDMADAVRYLESQQSAYGEEFLARIRETIGRISSMPEMYGLVWRNVRAARLRQFTYLAYYRVLKDRIELLAEMHGSRDTSEWKRHATKK